jgi:hypothetical protein
MYEGEIAAQMSLLKVIVRHDLQSWESQLVASSAFDGVSGSVVLGDAVLSRDGRRVAFVKQDRNTDRRQVFLWDSQGGARNFS